MKTHKSVPVSRLLELLTYDTGTGKISIVKSGRVLVADEAGMVTLYDPIVKIKRKMKLDVLAWSLFYKTELDNAYRIFHKNLDTEDNSPQNLVAILRQEFTLVTEALNNLKEYIKVTLHNTDQYKYVLHFRQAGIERKETYNDIDAARQAQKEVEVYFVKLINKYTLTV